jgi:hypothetical protein
MSHSDCALIDCTERDATYITLSCVLLSVVVDSGVEHMLFLISLYSDVFYLFSSA